MDIVEQKKAAEQFVNDWTGRGDEKQDTQNYWNQLLRTVYGVSVPEQYIAYEKPVAKGFIDAYIADTRVLIEQKGMAFDLDVKEPRQGRMVTPYEQARDYVSQLSLSEKPRYIITCNFQKIRIYDCNIQPSYNRKTDTWYAPFEEIELKDLVTEYRRHRRILTGGGMHYTSIENIHKVIDPLFLDELKLELDDILKETVVKTKQKKLKEYQDKLATIVCLDPAAGSGNFLTESYLSLRRLENRVLQELHGGQMTFADTSASSIIKVSIGQFYGIEINDFAVTVARTALWIAENQMLQETESILFLHLDFLPLKSYPNIHEGNALRMDWREVVPSDKVKYIMGNPPFHGFTFMTNEQKNDMGKLFPGVKNLDYVCGWYKKAHDYIHGTRIEVAFVSTNSITQGETVSRFWEFMDGVHINYAYRTFVWDSEASAKAHVHCVIISFATFSRQKKIIFDGNVRIEATNINPYLIDGDDILVHSRNKPLCSVPKMIYGNKPADGGNLIIEESDYEDFIRDDPESQKYIRPLLGSAEYINNKKRWCLWLVGADPADIKKCPLVLKRIEGCRQMRENSIAEGIRKFAVTPSLFAQRTQPVDKDFIIVPRVSSQTRNYVPMGFVKAGTIVTDRVQIIPDADLYVFGVIISNVHMAWMRVTCMRLKSDYSYSKDVVYNNFPWPSPDGTKREAIKKTAQGILDARALYPDSSLADFI